MKGLDGLKSLLVCSAMSAFLLLPGTVNAAQSLPSEGSKLIFDRTTTNGIVFVDETGLEAPYRVTATADAVFVNGARFESEIDHSEEDDDSNADVEDNEEAADDAEDNRHARRNFFFRPWQRGGAGVQPWQHRRPNTYRDAQAIFDWLENDEIVLAFNGAKATYLGVASNVAKFAKVIVGDDPSRSDIEEYLSLGPAPESRQRFQALMDGAVVPDSVREKLSQELDFILEAERQSLAQLNATHRLDLLAYPLTMVGMILGVIAFGLMMQWSGKGITAQVGSQESDTIDRFMIASIRLMLAMSALDLTWTILAGQAGTMKEVNPVAAQFISSPMQLAIFKVIATSIGLGIIYIWRHRQQMQQAAWWICLIFVLLTFRWVMFDSMMT